MPFAECAGRSFTVISVQKNAPESSGVYGLSNAREWLFIGESDNIQAHLLEHLKDRNSVWKAQDPTGFTFEICSATERVARQAALIREFGPRFNRRVA